MKSVKDLSNELSFDILKEFARSICLNYSQELNEELLFLSNALNHEQFIVGINSVKTEAKKTLLADDALFLYLEAAQKFAYLFISGK
jgi:hypothetical protein